jgi:hypothetical protein
MHTRADKGPTTAASRSPNQGRKATTRLVDNRPPASQLREPQNLAPESVQGEAIAQLKATTGPSEQAALVHQTAAQGVTGSGHRLPHHDTIQKAFGSHILRDVQAYTGPAAAAASRAIGAEAYASGKRVAFASSSPSLHTAAHEAAHVIQQQAGVQLLGGVGAVGDRYERHADAVADAVVAGRSAKALLDEHVGSSAGGGAPTQLTPLVQRASIAWPAGGWSKEMAGAEFYDAVNDKLILDPLANYPHITDEGKTAIAEGKPTGEAMGLASAADWKRIDDQPAAIPVKFVSLHKDKKAITVVAQGGRGFLGAMNTFNAGANRKDAQEADPRHLSTHPEELPISHRHTVMQGGATIDGSVLDSLVTALANNGALLTRAQWDGEDKNAAKATARQTYKALFREKLL